MDLREILWDCVESQDVDIRWASDANTVMNLRARLDSGIS